MSETQTEYNLDTEYDLGNYKDFNNFVQFNLDYIGEYSLATLNKIGNSNEFLSQIKTSADYDLDKFLEICFRYLLSENKPLNFIINTCMSILDSKKHDYSKSDNRYSNFEFTKEYAQNYVSNVEGVFVVMLGVKVARLIELIGNDKNPNNESILDSVIDLMNYRLLLEGYRMGLKI